MSHEISINRNTGIAEAMYAIEPAWHGLGTVVSQAPTSREAFQLAGLDWDVETRELFYSGIGDNGQPSYNQVDGRVATIRVDTGACLGVVSNNYKIVQNSELFRWCDQLVNTGDVLYESAGALKGGRIVWVLARLPQKHDFVCDGDQLARYLLMYNSHDGSNAVTIQPTSVRVVCWNTISLASPGIKAQADGDTEATAAVRSNSRRGGIIRVSHTANVKMKLDDARKILTRTGAAFDSFAEEARKLAEIRINSAQFDAFIERLIPTPATGELPAGRAKTRAAIRHLYENGREQSMCRDTAWAALNAVTHFIDHDWTSRAKDPTDRKAKTLFSIWFGNAGGFKHEARKTALEMFASA
jgi:phage/plasmid-like protein (TIGR03299 family)